MVPVMLRMMLIYIYYEGYYYDQYRQGQIIINVG